MSIASDAERLAALRRHHRRERLLVTAVVALVLVVLAAARVGWAVLVHDDWTCAIATCVKVDEVRR